jgi:hypothetical protein
MTTYELKKKCANCGIPNLRHMFCAKCDKIIYVSYRFDGYIVNPEHRLAFLEALAKHNICDVTSLIEEAKRRDNNAGMHSLAKRIRITLGSVPPDLSVEIFRRALNKSIARARQEAEGAMKAEEAARAVYEAMNGATAQPI